MTLPDEHRYGPEDPSNGEATSVTAYLLAGPLAFGAIGYGLDRLMGLRGPLLAVGVIVGVALALYVIWLRYGGITAPHEGQGAETTDSDAGGLTPGSERAFRTTIEETT